LLDKWRILEPPVPRVTPAFRPPPIHSFSGYPAVSRRAPDGQPIRARTLEGGEQDRPPLVDVCVGRETELAKLLSSTYRICFITGFGGQGKFTLAAQYFSTAQAGHLFDYYIWRDCKEEGERFENQLIAIIERLSEGQVSGSELSQQPVESLTELFVSWAKGQRMLLVFDNVDHYVDLESGTLTGNASKFVDTFVSLQSNCRVVFTCRPSIQYRQTLTLSMSIEGLDLESSIQLFSRRGANATHTEIEQAHSLTRGHAFWLDLMAAQVAKRAPTYDLERYSNRLTLAKEKCPRQRCNPYGKPYAIEKCWC
jgi:hypothetical protein